MHDKPWLGAQEAHYASLLWHLNVPTDYTSQIDAARSVFPGKAMVNLDVSAAAHAQVEIRGHAKAWITDMECATSFRPKMYGFDFARVTEVFENGAGEKRLIVEQSHADRKTRTGVPGERAMMKDLMLSTMREGGEVCMTYHMLNPFQSPITGVANGVGGDQLGDLLGISATGANHLGAKDYVTDGGLVATARDTIKRGAELLGLFLEEVLASEHSGAKNIWLRPFHEPNINYFWWGHPDSASSGNFYGNFVKFWNFFIAETLAQVADSRRSRVKLVFCINGEEDKDVFSARLDQYFPTTAPAGYASEYTTFINSIDVLGLDYYEDWQKDFSKSVLPLEYKAIRAKTLAMNNAFNVSWEHALTEVSIRTKFKGKLYGAYDNDNQPDAEAAEWPNKIAGVLNRRFFEKVVYDLVKKEDPPKWVLFWVNRVGNAVISSFEPAVGAKANGQPEVFYNLPTNVFSDEYVEHYFPAFPAEPFVVETFKAGDSSGAKAFFPISQTEQVEKLPGASADPKVQREHVKPYKSAITDFFQMVPQARRTANAARFLEVEAFLKDPAQPRPNWDASPSAAERVDLLFDVL